MQEELEVIQPEESQEGADAAEAVESAEAAEERTLEDATHEPGALVEEEQNFEQAEAMEGALVEVMDNVEVEPVGEDGTVDRDRPGMVDGEEISEGSKDDDERTEATPINLPGPVAADEGISPMPVPNPEPVDSTADEGLSPLPIPNPEPALTPDDVKMEDEAPGREARELDPRPLVNEAATAEEVLETLSEEQKTALDGLNPGDREALLRVIGNSQQVLPDNVPGHSGGFIY
ncbi:MAG: hypothetical protein ISR58_05325 [Anaerolineales bacterium]|nr:hypothetical protein [Chloroflexota bacterium]MBL6980595.1 hypothetical protein [Anaerolineales bacterium]